MRKLTYSIISFSLVFLAGCKPNLDTATLKPAANPHSGARIDASYPLNWDTNESDHVKMPTVYPISISSPWDGGGEVTNMEDNMKNDYHKADGWVLLYNTFNTATIPPYYFFVLYNRYRGLMRIYAYRDGNGNEGVESTSLFHAFNLSDASSNTPLLNYGAQGIVNLDQNSRSSGLAVAGDVLPRGWYAVEYELAYDQNYAANVVFLDWKFRGINDAKVSLNGSQTGDLTGKVAIDGGSSSNTFNFSNASNIAINNSNGAVSVLGKAADDASIISKLGSAALDGVTDAITEGVSGIVKGIFSGIFGSGQEQETHLTLTSQLSLTGTIASQAGLIGEELPIPNGGSGDWITNGALGVFYIDHKPDINQTTYYQPQFGPSGEQLIPKESYLYAADANSFNLIFNPAIQANVDMNSIKKEVVIQDSDQYVNGAKENIQGTTYYTGTQVGIDNVQASIVGVRVSFNVVWNNGNSKATLVKTFSIGSIHNTDVTLPPGQSPW